MGENGGSGSGPLRQAIGRVEGAIPWYLVPFDRDGACAAPETRAALLDELASGNHTHVFVFSHGWNNDWGTATARYEAFIAAFTALRAEHALPLGPPYAPLLVGLTWPSTALVMPWEKGPRFAGAGVPGEADDDVAGGLREAAALLPGEDARSLERLARLPRRLEAGEARDMASLLARLLDPSAAAGAGTRAAAGAGTPAVAGADTPADTAPTADDLVASWRGAPIAGAADGAAGDIPGDVAGGEDVDEEFGTVGGGSGGDSGGDTPRAAGFFDKIDPRWAIRMFTVRLMKDRAGTVGWFGAGPLVRDILAASRARVHLAGHSYGGKVVLSALASAAPGRPVESILLLQPAVNAWCFAALHDGMPGGYRDVLTRVRQPILTTFSRQDTSLTKLFHRALTRATDSGEQRIAGAPPSRFAALGGFGPQGLGEAARLVPMRTVPERYALAPGTKVRVVGLDGGTLVRGHGDVVTPATAWALYCQAAEP